MVLLERCFAGQINRSVGELLWRPRARGDRIGVSVVSFVSMPMIYTSSESGTVSLTSEGWNNIIF